MNTTPSPDQALPEKVLAIGEAVTPEQIDSYRAVREIDDKSAMLRTVLASWERQHAGERSLRRTYALCLLVGLLAQALIANASFFLVAAKVLEVAEWLVSAFVVGTFAEIVALASIVTRYLFPDSRANELQFLSEVSGLRVANND